MEIKLPTVRKPSFCNLSSTSASSLNAAGGNVANAFICMPLSIMGFVFAKRDMAQAAPGVSAIAALASKPAVLNFKTISFR